MTSSFSKLLGSILLEHAVGQLITAEHQWNEGWSPAFTVLVCKVWKELWMLRVNTPVWERIWFFFLFSLEQMWNNYKGEEHKRSLQRRAMQPNTVTHSDHTETHNYYKNKNNQRSAKNKLKTLTKTFKMTTCSENMTKKMPIDYIQKGQEKNNSRQTHFHTNALKRMIID